ncbi:MAG: phage/plasmid primase, P4 family [Campylobacterota bacterium]|nr:phage/plasmid primase, P4 family [Campylobacterota bacterium]
MNKQTQTEKVTNLFYSLPNNTKISKYFYQDKGITKFNDNLFRGSVIIHTNSIKSLEKDFMVLMGGRWKHITEESLIKLIKRNIVSNEKNLQYSDGQFKKIVDIIHASIEEFPSQNEIYEVQISSEYKVITDNKVYLIKYDYDTGKITTRSEPNLGQYYNFVALPDDINLSGDIDLNNYQIGNDAIDDFMNDITRNDTSMVKNLQEIAGYSMLFGHLEPYIYLAVGGGSNGKSVFATMLRQILGSSSVTSLEFSDINQQTTPKLESHFLNLPTELSGSKMLPENILKAITDGEPVSANEKYKVPRDITPIAKQFALANDLPAIKDATDGFWRRAVVIPFEMKVTKDSKKKRGKIYFQDLFKSEKDNLRNWAFIGLLRLIEQKGIHSHCDRILEASKKYQLDNNNALMFLKEFINDKVVPLFTRDEVYQRMTKEISYGTTMDRLKLHFQINGNGENSLLISELYKLYKFWCLEDGYKSLAQKNFKKKLEEKAGSQYFDFDFEVKKSSGSEKIFFNENDFQHMYKVSEQQKQLELDFEN